MALDELFIDLLCSALASPHIDIPLHIPEVYLHREYHPGRNSQLSGRKFHRREMFYLHLVQVHNHTLWNGRDRYSGQPPKGKQPITLQELRRLQEAGDSISLKPRLVQLEAEMAELTRSSVSALCGWRVAPA